MSKIKVLREAHGLTQEELGNILHVKKAAISKYEGGTVQPSLEVLKALSKYFKVSIDYLVDNNTPKTPMYHLVNEEPNLITTYRKLEPEKRQVLFGMLAFLDSPQSSVVIDNCSHNKNNVNENVFKNKGNNYLKINMSGA